MWMNTHHHSNSQHHSLLCRELLCCKIKQSKNKWFNKKFVKLNLKCRKQSPAKGLQKKENTHNTYGQAGFKLAPKTYTV